MNLVRRAGSSTSRFVEFSVTILGELSTATPTPKLLYFQVNGSVVTSVVVHSLSSFKLPVANWTLDWKSGASYIIQGQAKYTLYRGFLHVYIVQGLATCKLYSFNKTAVSFKLKTVVSFKLKSSEINRSSSTDILKLPLAVFLKTWQKRWYSDWQM